MKLNRTIPTVLILLGLVIQMPSTSQAQDKTHIIEIHAHRYAFSPAEITLKKGETVKLRLLSDDVAHSLLIPGLQINQSITKAHPTEVVITPTISGDFSGKCGRFCGSSHGSMVFTIHVKD